MYNEIAVEYERIVLSWEHLLDTSRKHPIWGAFCFTKIAINLATYVKKYKKLSFIMKSQ